MSLRHLSTHNSRDTPGCVDTESGCAMKAADELRTELKQHDDIPRSGYNFTLNRRDLFKVLGGGLLVCSAARAVWAQESGGVRHDQDLPTDISGWLHIRDDGTVKVFTGKAEMGQNIRT